MKLEHFELCTFDSSNFNNCSFTLINHNIFKELQK